MIRSLLAASVAFACEASPLDDDVVPTQTGTRIRITIGVQAFDATLGDNPTATAFQRRFPLTLDMAELNGNEKFARLATTLPSKASKPGTIRNGDLMLYGEDTLVIFYKTFSTSYSYTRLGTVDDPSGLAAALGAGGVTVTFAVKPS